VNGQRVSAMAPNWGRRCATGSRRQKAASWTVRGVPSVLRQAASSFAAVIFALIFHRYRAINTRIQHW